MNHHKFAKMDQVEICSTEGVFNIKEERIPRSILVLGLTEETTSEKLIIHFQRRKNGGGDIESIVVNEAKGAAVITFDKEEVLQTVEQIEHVINNVTLQVQSCVALGTGDEDYKVFERVLASFRLETLKHFSSEEIKELLKRISSETGVEWHEGSYEFVVSGSFQQIKECRCSLQQCVHAKEGGRPTLNGPGHGRKEPPLERDENHSVRGAYSVKTSSDGVNRLLNEELPMTSGKSVTVAGTSNASTTPNPWYYEIITKFMSFLTKLFRRELVNLENKYDVRPVDTEDRNGLIVEPGGNCNSQKHDEACERVISLNQDVYQNMQLLRFSLKDNNNVVHSRQLINEVGKKHPLLVDNSTNQKYWELYGEREVVKKALTELQPEVEVKLVDPVAGNHPSSDEEEVKDVDQSAEVPTLERPLRTQLGKMTLSVYKGDITDEQVDAIVNSTNVLLTLGSGVAGSILHKAGLSVQEECLKFRKRRESLNVGDAVATGAGDLTCRIIIHVAGPEWFIGPRKSKELLWRACSNCFSVAKERKMTSIAFPAISSGVFGMPKEVCAEVMFDSVDAFVRRRDSRKNTITDIRFVNIDDETVHVFREKFMQRYDSDQEQMHSEGLAKKASGLHRDDKADPTSEGATAEPECAICLEAIPNLRVLRCGHVFCRDCITEALKRRNICPVCKDPQSVIKGDQPPGEMSSRVTHCSSLPGYRGDGIITVSYHFPSGIQGPEHPNPGRPFIGTSRDAYLPNNQEGREVLQLLRRAFDAGLVFTIGRSVTTGKVTQVTWNDIHHKTNISGGPHGYGYPDPGYLLRVKEDLAAKGIR